MIFVDTDIFVIDKLFPEDLRYKANKDFLSLKKERCTSIYNVLELCGLASFSLSTVELRSLFTNFHRHYNLEIAYPKVVYLSPEEMLSASISRVFEKICTKMNYLDVQILLIAEEYDCSAFATWNKKHFEGRTHLPVYTPKEYETK
ncbi:MAG: hypothetical protein QW231_01795 [Candidatus Bathyarchaeia archaeon]